MEDGPLGTPAAPAGAPVQPVAATLFGDEAAADAVADDADDVLAAIADELDAVDAALAALDRHGAAPATAGGDVAVG